MDVRDNRMEWISLNDSIGSLSKIDIGSFYRKHNETQNSYLFHIAIFPTTFKHRLREMIQPMNY